MLHLHYINHFFVCFQRQLLLDSNLLGIWLVWSFFLFLINCFDVAKNDWNSFCSRKCQINIKSGEKKFLFCRVSIKNVRGEYASFFVPDYHTMLNYSTNLIYLSQLTLENNWFRVRFLVAIFIQFEISRFSGLTFYDHGSCRWSINILNGIRIKLSDFDSSTLESMKQDLEKSRIQIFR